MNLFFRILLAIYAFFLTIISLMSMVVTFKPELFDRLTYYVYNELLLNRTASIILFIVELIFFILSITFLLSGFKSDKDKKAISKHTNIGEIKISLDTIENIALAASRKINGVKDTKAYVIKHEDSVSVAIKAVVLAEINIPALSEDIQIKVKKSIEESSGVKVNDVSVVVENIYTGYKSRVE